MENKKIINGENAVLGRLASYTAKEALKGEEIIIVNCEKVLISGNKEKIKEGFLAKRRRVGTTQKGPKYKMINERIVKNVIRGMLPNYRTGRGRDAFKRIKCYNQIPKEYENAEMIKLEVKKPIKYAYVGEFGKWMIK